MKFGKITIIGSGRVGTSAAFALICQNIAKEITLLDINEDVLDAESIDLRDAKYFSYTGHVHKGNWEDAKDSQIIVICAGEVLRPESSLHQVVSANKKCLDDIFGKLGTLHSKCIVVVATSPVDAMTQYAQKLCGLPKTQVLGTGTLLDTQRLRVKLGKKFKINEKSVHAYVMGEKGDTAFVPWSHATIAGRKLTEFFAEDSETQSQLLDTFVTKIKSKTDKMLWSKHGTNFGIAACIAAVCKDIIYDTNMVLPLSCWVNEFGCYMSVLCTLGENGITKTLPLDLTDKEKQCFSKCCDSIWSCLKLLGFQKEGYGAIGEKKVDTGVSAPGGGLDWGTGSSVDVGKGPEIGGLGTDIGGFGTTGFQPLKPDLEGGLDKSKTEGFKESDIGTSPSDFSNKLATTDIRGLDLGGGKTTDLGSKTTTSLRADLGTTSGVEGGVATDLSKKSDLGSTETTGLGRDLGKSTDFGTMGSRDLGGLGTSSDIGGGLGTTDKGLTGLGTDFGKSNIGGTDFGGKKSDIGGLGTDLGTDLGGKKSDIGGLGTGLGTDIGQPGGLGKESSDIGGGLGTDIGKSDIGKTDIGGTNLEGKSNLGTTDTSLGSDIGKTDIGRTDLGGKKSDMDLGLGKGTDLGDILKSTDTSFGGGPGVGTTDKSDVGGTLSDVGKTGLGSDLGTTDVGQKSDVSGLGVGHTDIGEGLKKDLGQDRFGSENKRVVTDAEEGRGNIDVEESVGRPIVK